jgi:hypothetical protein
VGYRTVESYCSKYKLLLGAEALFEYFTMARSGEVNSYIFRNEKFYVTVLRFFRRFLCSVRSDPDEYRIDNVLTNYTMQVLP